jgi:hypothetical protein
MLLQQRKAAVGGGRRSRHVVDGSAIRCIKLRQSSPSQLQAPSNRRCGARQVCVAFVPLLLCGARTAAPAVPASCLSPKRPLAHRASNRHANFPIQAAERRCVRTEAHRGGAAAPAPSSDLTVSKASSSAVDPAAADGGSAWQQGVRIGAAFALACAVGATAAAGPAHAAELAELANTFTSTVKIPGLVGDNQFVEGAVSGFLLIFFSEIGDKTFFIALLLALRQDRGAVFAGTFGALAVMTVISVALGQVGADSADAVPTSTGSWWAGGRGEETEFSGQLKAASLI